MVRIKRAYDEPGSDDGYRVLVDRLWPRGRKKDALRLDAWAKDIAPRTADSGPGSVTRRRGFRDSRAGTEQSFASRRPRRSFATWRAARRRGRSRSSTAHATRSTTARSCCGT